MVELFAFTGEKYNAVAAGNSAFDSFTRDTRGVVYLDHSKTKRDTRELTQSKYYDLSGMESFE